MISTSLWNALVQGAADVGVRGSPPSAVIALLAHMPPCNPPPATCFPTPRFCQRAQTGETPRRIFAHEQSPGLALRYGNRLETKLNFIDRAAT